MAKKRAVARVTRKDSMPWGVKVISILNYVLFAVLLLSGVVFLFGAAAFSSSEEARMTALKFFEDFTASTTLAAKIVASFSAILIATGIIAILLSVLFFFMGRGLWRGKNWARILTIIFFTLGFVGALADILRGDFAGNIPELIIDGLVAGYLLFNKRVKAIFS
jgi:hypothetical protein